MFPDIAVPGMTRSVPSTKANSRWGLSRCRLDVNIRFVSLSIAFLAVPEGKVLGVVMMTV